MNRAHAAPLPPPPRPRSKAFVLEYEGGLRVVIHTANLIQRDMVYKTQGVYTQARGRGGGQSVLQGRPTARTGGGPCAGAAASAGARAKRRHRACPCPQCFPLRDARSPAASDLGEDLRNYFQSYKVRAGGGGGARGAAAPNRSRPLPGVAPAAALATACVEQPLPARPAPWKPPAAARR